MYIKRLGAGSLGAAKSLIAGNLTQQIGNFFEISGFVQKVVGTRFFAFQTDPTVIVGRQDDRDDIRHRLFDPFQNVQAASFSQRDIQERDMGVMGFNQFYGLQGTVRVAHDLNVRKGLDQDFHGLQYTRRVLRDEDLQGSHVTSVDGGAKTRNRWLAPL